MDNIITEEDIYNLKKQSLKAIFDYMVNAGYTPQNIAINKIYDYVNSDGNYTIPYYDNDGLLNIKLKITKEDYKKFLI